MSSFNLLLFKNSKRLYICVIHTVIKQIGSKEVFLFSGGERGVLNAEVFRAMNCTIYHNVRCNLYTFCVYIYMCVYIELFEI